VTASADTVTEGFDTFKAGWNSGWTAWELTLPEGWDYSGAPNYFDAGSTYKTAAPSVEISDVNTDAYLITPTLQGEFSFYIRNYTKNYQASITAYACTYADGVLTLGTPLGSTTLSKTAYGTPSWEMLTFTTLSATRVALLISKAYFDDFTYTLAEEGGGDDNPEPGTDPDPDPKPDPVPVMTVSTTAMNFGKVDTNATQDIVIGNTGDAELTATIASDSDEFTVSKSSVTVLAGAEETLTITYLCNGEVYGTHSAVVTITPNVGEAATIALSAYIQNPNVWIEDFSANGLPDGWKAGNCWTFNDGVAHAQYVHNANDYLTTPTLTVSGTADQLTFQARQTGVYPDIKIEQSLNGGEWTALKTIKSDDFTDDWQTFTIDGLSAGSYQFRFLSDSYDLDNFEGFRLNQEAPEMSFVAEDFVAGKVTEQTTKTYTVDNTGTGTLEVTIASDNEMFIVSPASLTITDEPQQFTVTFNVQEGIYGKFDATITVTPTYNESQAVTFRASAQVVDPNAWSEDFAEGVLPQDWSIIGSKSKWVFDSGEANGSYEPNGWLVTPKLLAEAGQVLTFQAKSKQYGTDLIVQYQKDGGEWTDVLSHSYEGQTDYAPFTTDQLEAGTYRFRFATENLCLDNFEGLRLAPTSEVKETWYVSYVFTYRDASGADQNETGTEEMEVRYDDYNVAFNFPNPITGNTWMQGTKDSEGNLVFANGQYIGRYGGESAYYCGSDGETLTDITFIPHEDGSSYLCSGALLINSSQSAISAWGIFTTVVVTKDLQTTHIAEVRDKEPNARSGIYDLSGRKVIGQGSVGQMPKGLYIVNGRKVVIK